MFAYNYFGKKKSNIEAKEYIKMFEETVKTYTEHLKSIEKSTGIKCLPTVTPFIPSENKVKVQANKINKNGKGNA